MENIFHKPIIPQTQHFIDKFWMMIWDII